MSSIFDIINIPLGYVMRFCYTLTGNYAIALLLFAIAMQIILLPLGIKQQKNMVKQAKMKPREMAIRKKYAGRTDKATQQKLNEEIMAMYQQEGASPFSGCLPLLVQLPILFALFNVVMSPLRYICGLTAEQITAVTTRLTDTYAFAGTTQISMVAKIRELGTAVFTDLAPGLTDELLPKFTVFGNFLDLSAAPRDDLWSPLLLIPLFTLVATVLSQKLTKKFSYNPNAEAQSNTSMKILEYSMPLMSVYFSFMYAGAIGIYWIFRNLLMTLQQFILSRVYSYPVFTEADYKAAEKAAGALPEKERSRPAGKVRSLHRIEEMDDEPEPAETEKPAGLGASLLSAPVKKDDRARRGRTDVDKNDGSEKDYTDLTGEDAQDKDGEDTDKNGDADTDENGETGDADNNADAAGTPKKPSPNAPKSNYSKTGRSYGDKKK